MMVPLMVPMVIFSPEDPSNWGLFWWAPGCCPEVSSCVVPPGTQRQPFAPPVSTISLAWLTVRSLISGCFEEDFFAKVQSSRSQSPGQVASSGWPLIQPTTGHLKGRKCLLWEGNLFAAFQHLGALWKQQCRQFLFRFCIRWTGKSLAIFLHTTHPDQKKFKITVRWICWACANSGLGNWCFLLKIRQNEARSPACAGTIHSFLVLTVSI